VPPLPEEEPDELVAPPDEDDEVALASSALALASAAEAPASGAMVKVQCDDAAWHVAPSPMHLQSVSPEHQPSEPCADVPAAAHACAGHSQTWPPQVAPGQSVSMLHARAGAAQDEASRKAPATIEPTETRPALEKLG